MTLRKIEHFLLFLCFLFLPTQLGKHFFLKFSYIYSLPVDYLAPTIYLWDLILVSLILVWVLRKSVINGLALNLLLFFLFTQAISLIKVINLGAGLYRLEQYILVGLFGFYVASQKYEDLKKILILALGLGLLFESILTILQFIFRGSIGFWLLGERTFTISTPSIARFDFYGQVFLRPYGTFSHPNVLAAFLLIAVFLIFKLGGFGRLGLLRVLFSVIAIFLTFSRGAIFILVIWLFIKFRKKLRYLWPLFFVSPFLIIRFWGAFNFDSLALIQREQLAIIAYQFFLDAPLTGVGLNNFINQTAISNLVAGATRFLQPVHNIFLLALSETGLLGGLGLLGLLGAPIVRLWRRKNLANSRILLGCWIIIILLGMLDHYFLTLPQGQRLFFLIWGLSLIRMNK